MLLAIANTPDRAFVRTQVERLYTGNQSPVVNLKRLGLPTFNRPITAKLGHLAAGVLDARLIFGIARAEITNQYISSANVVKNSLTR